MLNAHYTMCFKDVLTLAPDILQNLVLDTTAHTEKFQEMLKAKWAIYEISGETIPEFQVFLEAKFNQYKDYYIEMINAYETQIQWLDGDVISETYNITDTNNEKYTPKVAITTTDTPRVTTTDSEYDLPRSASSENRPSGKSITEHDGTNTRVVSPDGTNFNETDSTKTKTGGTTRKAGNPTELRKKYLDSIRSLYAEFAEKFKACFLDMY